MRAISRLLSMPSTSVPTTTAVSTCRTFCAKANSVWLFTAPISSQCSSEKGALRLYRLMGIATA